MIELYWMPGTLVSEKVLQEINEEFLRTISHDWDKVYKPE